jgi:ribosomal protein L35
MFALSKVTSEKQGKPHICNHKNTQSKRRKGKKSKEQANQKQIVRGGVNTTK